MFVKVQESFEIYFVKNEENKNQFNAFRFYITNDTGKRKIEGLVELLNNFFSFLLLVYFNFDDNILIYLDLEMVKSSTHKESQKRC